MQDSLSWIDKQEVGNMALMGVFEADTNRGGIYTFGRKYKKNIKTIDISIILCNIDLYEIRFTKRNV
jgi:outer membrane receptor for ferric coprogen and ferric-rhodotorulic acid